MTAQMAPAWLDRMYNNRTLVPKHESYFSRWSIDSAAARAARPCVLDMAYGGAPLETLDVFATGGAGAPVMVFIHGGYWRSLDKRDFSFVAPGFNQRGACVVVPNYPLCPGEPAGAVGVPDVCLSIAQALAWTWRNVAAYGGDPSRISIVGHSAGGHLAAMLLACDWKGLGADLPADLVRKAMSISGLYDLEPLVSVPFLKESLQLTPADALRASPGFMPAPKARCLYAVAGGDESAEFIRQNQSIQAAWGSGTVPVCELVPGANHFSVVDALIDPKQRLHARAITLLQD